MMQSFSLPAAACSRFARALTAVLIAAAWMAGIHSAQAQIGITKLPYTIKKAGRYSLSAPLTYSGTGRAISIEADDVSLDLRGRALTGSAAVSLANESIGIHANGRKNISIRNGIVRNFARGILLDGSNATGGHLIENVEIRNSSFIALTVKGAGSVIRGNNIQSVGADGGYTPLNNWRYGIQVLGDSVTVENNRIFEVYGVSSQTAYGLVVQGLSGQVVRNNVILGTPASRGSTNFNFALWLHQCADAVVDGNHCVYYSFGIYFNNCTNTLYRGNSVTGATSSKYSAPGSSLVDGGGNH